MYIKNKKKRRRQYVAVDDSLSSMGVISVSSPTKRHSHFPQAVRTKQIIQHNIHAHHDKHQMICKNVNQRDDRKEMHSDGGPVL
jgi:hypothetical protein